MRPTDCSPKGPTSRGLHLEISVQTYQRWRAQFKAMPPEDVVWLKALEKENARLKRLLAEKELDNDMLREVARGNW